MLFRLVHHTGHTFGLKAVDALHPLVRQRIGPKGQTMQHHTQQAKDQRTEDATAGISGNEQANSGQHTAKNLARDGGASCHAAFLIGHLRANTVAGQPCGQYQHTKGQQVQRQPLGVFEKGAKCKRQRHEKQHIRPPHRAAAGRNLHRRISALYTAIRAELALETLGHLCPSKG